MFNIIVIDFIECGVRMAMFLLGVSFCEMSLVVIEFEVVLSFR